MLTKKFRILSLIGLVIVGALFTMLGSNMFFSDIGNIAVGFARSTMLITIPAAAVAVTFAIAILYLVRVEKHPDCLRRITKLYLILIIAINGLGIVCNIAGSLMVYGTLVARNPFPGYTIIFLVLELAMVCGSIFGLLKLKLLPEDQGRVKINFLYVLKTIGWFLFIMLLLNRLGTLLGSPFYVYLRNLYKTFPFYIYLLVPLFLGVLEVLYVYKLIEKKQLLILTIVGLGVNVVSFVYIAVMGIYDTAFISSLSEAMPLERLASKPLELLIHVLSYLGVGAALLVQNLKKPKEVKE